MGCAGSQECNHGWECRAGPGTAPDFGTAEDAEVTAGKQLCKDGDKGLM